MRAEPCRDPTARVRGAWICLRRTRHSPSSAGSCTPRTRIHEHQRVDCHHHVRARFFTHRAKRRHRMSTEVLRRAPRAPKLSSREISRIGDQMLAELGLEHADLSVLLTDDDHVRQLNRRYRDKDRPTDVLSFPLDAPKRGHNEPFTLGDVVISIDTAARQARSRKRDLIVEVTHLLAHGLLHLIGHDHRSAPEKQKMWALTRVLCRAVDPGLRRYRSGPTRTRRRGSPGTRGSRRV
jgi:probable rRNA maturation factor